MRGMGLIIFLLVVVVQIISAVIQQRKKERERKEREALRRMHMPQTGTDTASRQPPLIGEADRVSDPDARMAELETRRREQLEQLRARRDARRGGGAPTPIPVRPGRTPARRDYPTGGSDARLPQPVVIARRGDNDEGKRRRQQAEREMNEQEHERRRREAERRAAAKRAARKQELFAGQEELLLKQQKKPQSTPVTLGGSLAERLRDPQVLRQIILMQEILGPPRANRDIPY